MNKQNDKQKKRAVFQDNNYIYINVTKVQIFTILAVVLLIAFGVFAKYVLISPMLKRDTQAKVAVWMSEKPILQNYVPVSWLPQSYILSQVLPQEGFQTEITLNNTVSSMIENGVIDVQKFEDMYSESGGIPEELQSILSGESNEPLKITSENSTWLINILWPLGLSNKMRINETSPISGENVYRFASTGGWTLGKEANGGYYFNSLDLIKLNDKQENRIKKIAEAVYRPCCDNHTFFQDCNHGSAALGLITLAVSQGLTDEEIYETVLYFNSFWFPQNYSLTALYLQQTENEEWENIDPEKLLSSDYSSISGWSKNIRKPSQNIPGLIPEQTGGSTC